MAEKLVMASTLVNDLKAALARGDGYIMGATGQNPRKWKENSWWFNQYDGNPKQKAQALKWRETAERVWDCNGLAEGIYKDHTEIDINSKARYNYAQWCGIKGTGLIPPEYRKPGAAVFWGETAASITHVAYLVEPVNEKNPGGDWYLIEARGVMYGVVKTKLSSRKPRYWGLMTKYFNYEYIPETAVEEPEFGLHILQNGMEGSDVRELQTKLIRLGYDLGRWGADGDFGDMTEMAVIEFQTKHNLNVTGFADDKTIAAIDTDILALDKTVTSPRKVEIVGGNCYVRSAPKTSGKILGVATNGTKLSYQGETNENDWHLVAFNNQNGWVSGKYGKLTK